MKLAICEAVVNKSTDWEILATEFVNKDLTILELANEVNNGHAFSTQHKGRRQQENFLASGYIGLDFDRADPEDVEAVLNDPLVSNYYGLFYYTPSSTPEAPRFRLVFELDQPTYDADYYREIVGAFIWKFSANVDRNCSDPCRLFYGSKNSGPVYTENKLPMSVVVEVLKEHRAYLEQERKTKEAADNERRKIITPAGGNSEKGKKAYFDKVLSTHCDHIRQAAKGTRHHTLRNSAQVMGGYIAGEPQVASEYDIRTRLEEAYSSHDNLNRFEMKKAIDWGFKRGKEEPIYIASLPEYKNLIDFKEWTGKNKVDPETGEVTEEVDDSALAEFEPNDEGNADAFRLIYGEDFLNCDESGWLNWNGKFWESSLAVALLDQKVTEVLRRRRVAAANASKESVIKCSIPNRGKINPCIQALEKRLMISISSFDNKPDLLNCNNGVVDLKTGKLYPHDRNQRFTYAISTNYKPGTDYSAWAGFLSQVIGGGQEVIDYLKKAIGYSLTGYTSEECLFYCYGPTRSGKGTFTEALLQLLGDPLSSEVDFNTFTAPREADNSNFDLAQLKPARILFASESTRHRSLNSAKVKALTGGNQVRCCFKHKSFFNYRPNYSIWLTSNWPVNGDVDDDALWGRLRVIEFPNSFLGKEDKSLKHKIKSPEMLEGILAWAVEGAQEWYKSGSSGLKTPDLIKEVTSTQRVAADFVQMWLDECTEPDQSSWESNAFIMDSYKRWCESNGIEAKQMRSLSISLKQKGFETGIQVKRNGLVSKGVQGFRVVVTQK